MNWFRKIFRKKKAEKQVKIETLASRHGGSYTESSRNASTEADDILSSTSYLSPLNPLSPINLLWNTDDSSYHHSENHDHGCHSSSDYSSHSDYSSDSSSCDSGGGCDCGGGCD